MNNEGLTPGPQDPSCSTYYDDRIWLDYIFRFPRAFLYGGCYTFWCGLLHASQPYTSACLLKDNRRLKTDICILIPAFNAGDTIGRVIKGCKIYVEDVIVVDDGSRDNTSIISEAEGAIVLKHERNMGKGMALRTGFAYAISKGYEGVITMDADGQHNPDDILRFIEAFKNDSGDIIIGSRLWDRGAIPIYRYIPNMIGVVFISKAVGLSIQDTQSGYRLYRKNVLKRIRLETTGFERETEILIKAGRMGFRINSVPVKAIYPEDYKTHFRPLRDFYRISILVLKSIFGRYRNCLG